MNRVITIVSYNRPLLLERLLVSLKPHVSDSDYIVVFDDCSKTKTADVLRRYSPADWTLHRFVRHQGRLNHWRLWNTIVHVLDRMNWDHWLAVPDDVWFPAQYRHLHRLAHTWARLIKHDPFAVTLNLCVDSRGHDKCWTGQDPVVVRIGNTVLHRTQWVDMCFYTDRRFLEAVDWFIRPTLEYMFEETRGSGVGRSVSTLLYYKDLNMYQVDKTAVFHGSHTSVMHPEYRKDNPL